MVISDLRGLQMGKPQILWIDLCRKKGHKPEYSIIEHNFSVITIKEHSRVTETIQTKKPVLICFEYDCPDIPGLLLLKRILQEYSDMPVIMLTQRHSEALAVWALRSRVWDYLVKPIEPWELITSIENYLHSRQLINPIPVDLRFHGEGINKTSTAKTFVEKHYHEKIREEDIAQLCGMNTACFSRLFKQENNITFRKYLVNYRIHKAQELLADSMNNITDVSYTVGFSDPSYFSRVFRKIVGVPPSHYQAS